MKNVVCLVIAVLFAVSNVPAQSHAAGRIHHSKQGAAQYGTASYYANKFQGRATASGELYDKNKMTCAHNSLPMGTWLKVTNLRNKKHVLVRVTDRLHPNNKRLVDLSRIAASKLGYLSKGITRVKVEIQHKPPVHH